MRIAVKVMKNYKACQRLEHEGLEVKISMKIVGNVCVIIMCIIKNIGKVLQSIVKLYLSFLLYSTMI